MQLYISPLPKGNIFDNIRKSLRYSKFERYGRIVIIYEFLIIGVKITR